MLIAAASPASARIRSGLELGPNIAFHDYDGNPDAQWLVSNWDQHSRPGVTGGITLGIPVRQHLELITGVRYLQTGNHVQFKVQPPSATRGEFWIREQYASIPARVRWTPGPSRAVFGSIGPELAVLIHGGGRTELTAPIVYAETMSLTKILNPVVLMGSAEAGTRFGLGNHTGVATLRFTRGLTNASKHDQWVSNFATHDLEFLAGLEW